MAKYVIEAMYQADKRDPAAITAVAELIKTSRDIILYSNFIRRITKCTNMT